MPVSFLHAWVMAIRPRTLWASVAPVLIGTAMAYGDRTFHGPSALAALTVALLIQIATNLSNDYFDSRNGVDGPDRKGPARVTSGGLIAPQMVKTAFILAFVLAAITGCYLVARAGFPVIIIGVLSVISGIWYTAGPRPLSHLGLGEVFVLVFFGPVATAGTYFVQARSCSAAVIMAGLLPGFLSTAILVVNNLRDIDTDRRADKRTLAVRFGRSFARAEYVFCLLAAAMTPVIVHAAVGGKSGILLAALPVLLLIPCIQVVCTQDHDGLSMNKALAATGRILFLQALVFSILWII